MKSAQPRGLSVKFCAHAMGVDESTFRRWCRKKLVRHSRTPGGRIRVEEEELARLMAGGLVEAAAPALPAAPATAKERRGYMEACARLKADGIG